MDLKRKMDINGTELCDISPFFSEEKMVYCGIQNVVKTKVKNLPDAPRTWQSCVRPFP